MKESLRRVIQRGRGGRAAEGLPKRPRQSNTMKRDTADPTRRDQLPIMFNRKHTSTADTPTARNVGPQPRRDSPTLSMSVFSSSSVGVSPTRHVRDECLARAYFKRLRVAERSRCQRYLSAISMRCLSETPRDHPWSSAELIATRGTIERGSSSHLCGAVFDRFVLPRPKK